MEIPDSIETENGRDILPPAFVESIWDKLLQSYPVTPQQLKQLAQDRANNIAKYLIEQTALPQQRIFILNAQVKPEENTHPGTVVKVPLALTAK